MEPILGSDLMVFKSEGEGAGASYKAFANATTCSLNLTAGALETSSKDSGKWTDKKAGKLSWSLSSENLYTSEDFKALVDAWIKREKLLVAFDIATNADNDSGLPANGWTIGTTGYEGNVIITSLTANAPDGENATYSVTFEGTGELKPRKAA